MSAEINQGLVRKTFREIDSRFGDLMDKAIGTKNSGLIPLEVSLEVLEGRVMELDLNISEVFEGEPPGTFSRLFVIRQPVADKSVLLFEFEEGLWVHNGEFF